MKALFVESPGGPESIVSGDLPKPQAAPGQAVVKLVVSGVNFIDVYFRTGLYKANPPIVLGMEGAGVIESVGEGVTEVAPGDRVAYAMARGSYAECAVVPAWQLVKIPDSVPFDLAAAVMLQGMTAHYLTHSTYALKPGDACLIHAAAGGTGQLLVQMAKKLGATVFGTAGSDEKCETARQAGADHAINYSTEDFQAFVRDKTGGRGVDVVYDSVGKAVFARSLDCLRPRGLMATFGNASGAVPPFEPLLLSQKGSLFLTRPSLAAYAQTRDEIAWRAGDVLRWVGDGSLKVKVDRKYPITEAAQAHRDLEARKTSGKLLLDIQQ